MLKLFIILLGYVLASFSVGLTFPTLNMELSFTQVNNYASLTAIIALPGFVILRGLMAWFKLQNVVIYALAGGLNALATLGILASQFLVTLVISGAIAGVVCYLVEWYLGSKFIAKRDKGIAT